MKADVSVFIIKDSIHSKKGRLTPMPRRKTNQVRRYNRTINTRIPSLLDHQIQSECRRLDIPMSLFARKAFEQFLIQIRSRRDALDLPAPLAADPLPSPAAEAATAQAAAAT